MIETPDVVVEPSEPAFILPLLDASDALVRDALVSLSRHEGLHRWLAVDDLIRKFVGFTQGVSEGRVIRSAVQVLAPRTGFSAIRVGDNAFILNPASYARYDKFTWIVDSVDAEALADFYVLITPLWIKPIRNWGCQTRISIELSSLLSGYCWKRRSSKVRLRSNDRSDV